jgi:predicted transcriptional regulator
MQLVGRCIQIIELFLEQSTENWFGVNEIIKKTGSLNRPGIIRIIKVLEEEGVLTTIKSKKHGKLTPMELTPLGIEILELIKSIKKIEQLDIKLQKSHSDFNIILAKKKW